MSVHYTLRYGPKRRDLNPHRTEPGATSGTGLCPVHRRFTGPVDRRTRYGKKGNLSVQALTPPSPHARPHQCTIPLGGPAGAGPGRLPVVGSGSRMPTVRFRGGKYDEATRMMSSEVTACTPGR